MSAKTFSSILSGKPPFPWVEKGVWFSGRLFTGGFLQRVPCFRHVYWSLRAPHFAAAGVSSLALKTAPARTTTCLGLRLCLIDCMIYLSYGMISFLNKKVLQ
jgi:hypothetical protein